jgi:cupin 2 domain-containing protein
LLLEGRATLEIAGEAFDLAPGDQLFIPACIPHRVTATFPEPRCLWVAGHIFPEEHR